MNKYKKQIIIGGAILIIISIIFIISKNKIKVTNDVITDTKIEVKENTLKEEKIEIETEKEQTKYIYIDIKGEVKTPGVYKIEEGAIILNAIEKAGGLTKNSDTRSINLSKKLVDEMVIIIHSKTELNSYLDTKEKEKNIAYYCAETKYNVDNGACFEKNNSEEIIKVSINNATKEELQTLIGIGEDKALAILEYRLANNGFKTIEELMNVSGIGEATFAKIKENITL